MQLSGSYKKRCPRAFPMSGPTAVNRPRHGKGTRAYSRLTDINPYSAPVIRGHMCLACCTRPIAAITTSPKAIGASPYSLGVIRSCSYRSRSKKRCPRAFPMSGPTAVNRPRHGKGTRAYSRLTEVNPYSAPVIRGHMCLACQKSRFSHVPPLQVGSIRKKDYRYPLALCCLCGTCRACTTINRYPLAP